MIKGKRREKKRSGLLLAIIHQVITFVYLVMSVLTIFYLLPAQSLFVQFKIGLINGGLRK